MSSIDVIHMYINVVNLDNYKIRCKIKTCNFNHSYNNQYITSTINHYCYLPFKICYRRCHFANNMHPLYAHLASFLELSQIIKFLMNRNF